MGLLATVHLTCKYKQLIWTIKIDIQQRFVTKSIVLFSENLR